MSANYPEFKHCDISHLDIKTIERAKKVRFLVLDIDGVCTDGKLYMDAEGHTTKAFDTQDGIGIVSAIKAGINIGIITGRQDSCVEARMKPLGIVEYHCGKYSKLESLKKIAERQRISFEEMAYMGDDWIDIDPLCHVGMPIAVANARKEVKDVASYTTKACGGAGAVREAVEIILACQNAMPPIYYWICKD